jgi:hypothetical protein
VDQWTAIRPWERPLNVGSEPQKQILATHRGNKLDSDRKAVPCGVQRERDRRLTAQVEGKGEGRIVECAFRCPPGLFGWGFKFGKKGGRLRHGGREKKIES